MKTKSYHFYYIDRDSNVLLKKQFECHDAKDAHNVARRLFATTMQNDCVKVTFKKANK